MAYMYNIHLHTYIQELHDLIETLYIGIKFKSKEAIQVSSCVCMHIGKVTGISDGYNIMIIMSA